MADTPERKLAVLLHADVVGSTALVQKNESIAHERIRDAFQRFSNTIRKHGGNAHEIRGDALVAEFSRASDAVEAALSFQATNTVQTQDFSDDIKPVVRVGIAMGEVVVADNTVTGEGVVLAQRLEQLAEPGGVCIQDAAYQTVPKRLPFTYESLGEREVKGFNEPVRAYAVRRTPDSPATEPETATQVEPVALELPEEPSIAVLPFANMSGDPEQEHFSDGITEDIITALSRISGLFVIARNSTMVYKGKAVDVKQVGREQGVRYVLEGSVRKAGNRVRVTAQLNDATTGNHRWAERYDRDLTDIFAVQDEITRNVTVAVHVELTEGEQAKLWAGGTEIVEAWECVIRGSELTHSHARGNILEARRLAERAIAIDPDYADAHVVFSLTHYADALWGYGDSREENLSLAEKAARQAIELDGLNPDGHAVLALIKQDQCEFDQGVEIGRKAIALAPNHARNLALVSAVMVRAGKYQDGLREMRRAIRLSPNYPAWYMYILGTHCFALGEYAEAVQAYQSFLSHSDPDSEFLLIVRVLLAVCLASAGRDEEAGAAYAEVFRHDPDFCIDDWWQWPRKDASLRGRAVQVWGNLAASSQ